MELLAGHTTATTDFNQATVTDFEVFANAATGFVDETFGSVDTGTRTFEINTPGWYSVDAKCIVESRGTANCVLEGYIVVNGTAGRPAFVTNRSSNVTGRPLAGYGGHVLFLSNGDQVTFGTKQIGGAGSIYSYQPSSVPASRLRFQYIRPDNV